MELSNRQEEILEILNQAEDYLYEAQIVEALNCDRPKGWKEVSQPSVNKILSRMAKKELLGVYFIDKQNYNRQYYKILDAGTWSLMQAKDNRKRLAALKF